MGDWGLTDPQAGWFWLDPSDSELGPVRDSESEESFEALPANAAWIAANTLLVRFYHRPVHPDVPYLGNLGFTKNQG